MALATKVADMCEAIQSPTSPSQPAGPPPPPPPVGSGWIIRDVAAACWWRQADMHEDMHMDVHEDMYEDVQKGKEHSGHGGGVLVGFDRNDQGSGNF